MPEEQRLQHDENGDVRAILEILEIQKKCDRDLTAILERYTLEEQCIMKQVIYLMRINGDCSLEKFKQIKQLYEEKNVRHR